VQRLLTSVLVALFVTAMAYSTELLYDQPAGLAGGGVASQNAPNSFGDQYTAFDNFSLLTGASITGVQWQGSYSSMPISLITQFQILFLADNGGLPGGVLRAYDIPGNAGETFVGTSVGFFEYSYTLNLPTAFGANANTQYWLSIQPTVDFPPQWFWREGTGGDGQSAQINLPASPNPSLIAEDNAFSLTGTTVPEPSALQLLSISLLVIGFSSWRRARRT
jgi:hypothetical protein